MCTGTQPFGPLAPNWPHFHPIRTGKSGIFLSAPLTSDQIHAGPLHDVTLTGRHTRFVSVYCAFLWSGRPSWSSARRRLEVLGQLMFQGSSKLLNNYWFLYSIVITTYCGPNNYKISHLSCTAVVKCIFRIWKNTLFAQTAIHIMDYSHFRFGVDIWVSRAEIWLE